jgi:hypothetical protein
LTKRRPHPTSRPPADLTFLVSEETATADDLGNLRWHHRIRSNVTRKSEVRKDEVKKHRATYMNVTSPFAAEAEAHPGLLG